MAKNPFTVLPKQMAFAMSPSYSHTVSAVAGQSSLDEEDDNDICPVCDGECTCSNNVSRSVPPPPPPPSHAGPLSMEELSRQYKVVTSSSTPSSQQRPSLHTHQLPKPSLKIKLTLPKNLIAKRHQHADGDSTPLPNHYLNPDETMSAEESDEEPVAGPSTLIRSPPLYEYPVKPPPKKRGRPRKIVAATAPRDHSVDSIHSRRASTSPVHKRANPKASIVGRPKSLYAAKVAKNIKSRVAPPKKRTKKPAPKRRRPSYMGSDDPSSESSFSDDDVFGPGRHYDLHDADDIDSVQFPTFVSASALSSMESDDSSSLSDFSDSSMEKEEEGFILSEIQQRARVNRELLGENSRKGGQSQHNEWVIQPRKKSEGPSDVELDSDATEDDDDEEVHAMQEADEDEDEDETDGHEAGGTGLVTGWSDDEESSFDADLFFANLSTSSDSDSSSDESMRNGLDDGDDDTVSDDSTEAGLLHMREELENLPLELTESWDGHLVFTNGMHATGGGGIIDIDFERNVSQFIPAPPPCCSEASSPNHEHTMVQEHSDVEMSTYGSDMDDGYEEDGGEGEGDTTDEELVGEDDLPNERAMRLFNWPLSVNAINPLSTVSPITPAKRDRFIGSHLPPPTPDDILSGRLWDSDEMDELFDQQGRQRSHSLSSRTSGGGPRKGVFVVVQETKQAVIDDSHSDIPSPHPRFNRNRRGRRLNAIESLLRKHLSTLRHEPSSFVSATTVIPDHTPLRLLPSVEIKAPPGTSSLNEENDADALTTPIELDDVLDAAFLHPDPSDSSQTPDGDAPPESSTTADESDTNQKSLRHLARWDVISVGAFRQTRENAGIMDSPGAPGWTPSSRRGSAADYGNILKASPFSTMLWPTNDKSKRSSKRDCEAVARALSTSPFIGPTRDDGDRTPTRHQGGKEHQQYDHKYTHKSKKQLKKEKRLKRKSYGPTHLPHHYHSHHHHPNSKSRATASSQRNNFLSSVPPLHL
ncbi:hypothetical protein CC2G_011557 [Coprinopsis cinerea AmutBmut pab1-1]|nr:hypothetical protein CC2G_011557 [Coprinopsis cinerea AmutBmut pab1-1]